MKKTPLAILQHIFGFEQFRGDQKAIIEQICCGGDALVLMPTGGGKSLCYQIPALIRDGVGVVISPLIALMQDQVAGLQQLGVKAACLHSAMLPNDQQQVETALRQDQLDLLYVAPERLLSNRCMKTLQASRLALLAIDEAHCVSQWGHDFRPEYLQLECLQQAFPGIPRLALTATADQPSQTEIIKRLQLQKAKHFISGFDRPNIRYRIMQKKNGRQQLLHFIRQYHLGNAGIIYCNSRKRVDELARWLCQQGLKALPYHAGLSGQLRSDNQAIFLNEESIVMVATIAFGMGINKPNVRFVAHLDLPRSIESYYQETGRAGRDGLAADAWMLYGLQDVMLQRNRLMASTVDDQIKRIEQAKLDAMLGLCEITSCRRQALLRYFDDPASEHCNNCDNCLEPVTTFDGTEVARKALSCVYRSGQRYGVAHLIDILLGKPTAKVCSVGHQHLSTFAIGQELDQQQWRSVFRQLLAQGLLSTNDEGYGGLKLKPVCRALLRGEVKLQLRLDRWAEVKKSQLHDSIPATDQGLWQALRAQRISLAREQKVPPYVIFNDATLMKMVHHKPDNLLELSSLNGVGDKKLTRYGSQFLAIIIAHSKKSENIVNKRKTR
jgi:ATP-dependent DNA helicase RecQ